MNSAWLQYPYILGINRDPVALSKTKASFLSRSTQVEVSGESSIMRVLNTTFLTFPSIFSLISNTNRIVPWLMSFISDRSASGSILQFGKLLDCQSCLGSHTSKLYPLISSRELGSYHSGVIKIESVDETLSISIWKFFVYGTSVRTVRSFILWLLMATVRGNLLSTLCQ